MEEYLLNLNPNQKQAVLETKGPILVIAGAGAGKTKVVTHRILHLIKNGVAPSKILAITFTNKAASEMRQRVEELLRKDTELNMPINFNERPFIGTFHSLGVKIIRDNPKEANVLKSFKILDRNDAIRIIKQSMQISGIDPKSFEPGKILSVISRKKGDFIDNSDFSNSSDIGYFGKLVSKVWGKYEEIKKTENSLDFDDLLLISAQVLKNNKNILEKYQNDWLYIHIDEYQDTNKSQYEIIKMISDKNKNIFAVGDADQNIYSWRGSDIKILLGFERDFPDAKTILLEENYRSTQNILSVANKIIAKNKMRKEKNLFTKNGEGEKIGLYEAYDEIDEARFIATKVEGLIQNGVNPKNIAVLYRANFQSRAIEEGMLDKNLSYQVIGTKFFERKEVKDIISYIRVALEKHSISDLERVINFPPRGIGKTTFAKISLGQENSLTPAVKNKISQFKEIISQIKNSLEEDKLSESVKKIIKISGVETYLKDEGLEGEERLENLRELSSLCLKYNNLSKEEALEKFLDDSALHSDQDEISEEKDSVKLMTVHASKGLEFDYVFITGLEEDLFPHKRISEREIKESEDEEERRLFYVALTRAKKKVYLSYAGFRTIFGSKQPNIPSEFLIDIDEEFIEREQPSEFLKGKIIYF
jgi:DNA helicase-2/ATP-dependent DNA helicase PcrA